MKRIPYDPNDDPFMGRLVKILDGEGPRRKWRHGIVGFSFNREVVKGNKLKEVATGKYQIMWGKFLTYEAAQQVKLAKQNWSSEHPEDGYPLLQLEAQGLLKFTDGKQPGTLNLAVRRCRLTSIGLTPR